MLEVWAALRYLTIDICFVLAVTDATGGAGPTRRQESPMPAVTAMAPTHPEWRVYEPLPLTPML
ncbi:MAG TPA: hypothetical protein VK816_05810, partial [Jatrophihabitantaceae bacterium]|nr:hypothetical protein [Jatrophihabitantaceae bacterium]